MLPNLLDVIDDAVAVFDTEQTILNYNAAWARQWGFPPDKSLIGQSLQSAFPKLTQAQQQHFKDTAQGLRCDVSADKFYCALTKKQVTVDWSLRPFNDEAVKPSSFLMTSKILRPIERELRSERAERERLSFALSGARDGIWDWDFLSGDVFFSPRYCTMLGYKPTELEHSFKTWEALVHPDDFDDAKSEIISYINGGTDLYDSEFRMRNKSGAYVWILARGEIVEYSADKSPRRLAGTHTDISQRKELEFQVLEAKKQAEEAAEKERRFLSTMSHEIRTPLTGMMGMLDTLSGIGLDGKDREKLVDSRKCAGTLLTILNGIMDLSEIQSGQFTINNKDFNVKDLVEHSVAVFRSRAQQKDLTVKASIKPSANRWVHGDNERISQILFNLTGNAIKFADSGTINIFATCLDSDDSDDEMTLLFSVEDQGIGIPEEYLATVFDQFQQVDTRLERKFQGSGLGLSVVHQLATLMGGEVDIESQVDVGTKITIKIPVSLGSHASTETVQHVQTTDFSKYKILVAEDISVNQKILKHYLDRMHCNYEMVDDGEKAVLALERDAFDLILMDIQMPKLNGIEASKLIRESDRPYADIPIVALTANVFASDIQDYFNAGMERHLAKPFTYNELQRTLTNCFAAPKKSKSKPKAPFSQKARTARDDVPQAIHARH